MQHTNTILSVLLKTLEWLPSDLRMETEIHCLQGPE